MSKFNAITLKTAVAITIAFTCIAAQAADWRVIGSTDAGELSMDAASVTQKGDVRQAWSMWNFKDARPNSEPGFPTFKSYQDMHSYNCKDKTMRLTSEIIYADNNGMGDKRDHSDALKGMAFAAPVPGSVAEIMLKQVCSSDVIVSKQK